jgi:phenylacetate-coenzyme A ligase PaaK-like adenylate-forming protein
MKTFRTIREAANPTDKVVFDKKIDRVPVKIVKVSKGYDLFIDGDRLDTFKSQAEAEKTAKTVIKELQ